MTAPTVLRQPVLGGRIRSTLPAGTQVGGYVIGRELGAGSMGKVYAAQDADGNDVAIKFLHRHLDVGSSGRAQLEREVAALRKLKHASVARVIDAELDGTDAFIVTELVDGVTLQSEIDERGPLDPIDLFELADQLASALEAVHLAGVVHRDLKPSNVMVTDHGPMLIDFGIAQEQAAGQPGPGVGTGDGAGLVVGTPGYIDPELMSGTPPTATSDWWSWAAVLAFAATGRPPYGAAATDDILARAADGRVDLVGVRPRTAAALAAALHPLARTRWTPTEVIRELRRDASAFASVSAPESSGELPPPPPPPPQLLQAVLPDDVSAPPNATAVFAPKEPPVRVPTSVYRVGATRVLAPETPVAGLGEAPIREVAATRAFQVPPTRQLLAPAVQPVPPAAVQPAQPMQLPIQVGEPPQFVEPPVDPSQPVDPNQPAQGQEPTPPTWPYRSRRGLGWAMLLPFAVLAATQPLIAFLAFAVAVVVARTVGISINGLEWRRARAGRRRSTDGVVTAAKLPANVVRAILGALPQLLLGLAAGVVAAASGFWIFGHGRVMVLERPDYESQLVGGINQPIVFAVVLALAMAVAGLVTWFGTNSFATRVGARLAVNTIAAGRSATILVLVACLVAAGLAARGLFASPLAISWWPFGSPAGL